MNPFHKRAIAELLKAFSESEVKEFKKYVAYKGGKSHIALWDVLQKCHPHYNLTDKELFKKIRPKEAYKDNVFRVWVSGLARLAKEFVAMQAFQEDSFLYNNTLAMTLLQRRVDKMGQKVLVSNGKALENTEKPDSHFYTYYFGHEDIAYQYVTVLDHRTSTDSLQKATDYLDYSYLVQKLKFLCAMHNRRRIVKEKNDFDFQMEEQLLDYLKDNPKKDQPLIHLYYLMLRLLRNLDDHESFQCFRAYFEENRSSIHPTEARQLATGAINFCYWNILRGHQEFLGPRMELAEIMVKDDFVLVDGIMPPYHFRNLVRISIEAKNTGWTKKFIDKWLPRVDENQRPYLEAFNRAYLHFALGEYEKQGDWMRLMEAQDFAFLDIQNEIAFRILKLKTSYEELGRYPKPAANKAFHANLEAFRNFLRRNGEKIPEETKASANNFQKALNQLHQQKQGKALKVGDLRAYVLNLELTRDLPWLREKLKEVS